MTESPHYKELLQALNDCQVEYLIVGGYAVMKYTEPRYTKDLDVWVHNTTQNAARLFNALAKFGAPLQDDGVTPETFNQDGMVYQIGVAPVRIDILTQITGVQFAGAWQSRARRGTGVSSGSYKSLSLLSIWSAVWIDFEFIS